MKRAMIAGFAAGAAMMIGAALAAVTPDSFSGQARVLADAGNGVMNPMIGGQAMLPGRNLMENVAASPQHTALVAALRQSGIADALKGNGAFTIFAPTDMALGKTALADGHDKAALARGMGYLVVPGKYDSQALLKVINEGGGQASLRTLEGGTLLARMNGPTNIILMDGQGDTADIAIYDIYGSNGVMHVVDHMLKPGAPARELAAR